MLLGERIKYLMQQKGWSQMQLSEKICIYQKPISKSGIRHRQTLTELDT